MMLLVCVLTWFLSIYRGGTDITLMTSIDNMVNEIIDDVILMLSFDDVTDGIIR